MYPALQGSSACGMNLTYSSPIFVATWHGTNSPGSIYVTALFSTRVGEGTRRASLFR
jgi:hypothetical protein